MAIRTIPRKCRTCGDDFLAYSFQVKKGYGIFCGLKCAGRAKNKGGKGSVDRNCATCGKQFFCYPNALKDGGGMYCSLSCTGKRKRPDPSIRFWKAVNKTEKCWLWIKGCTRFGYSSFATLRDGMAVTRTAHRFSYELHYGPIPEGLCVLHHCDVPACVRPDHLFLGTKATNNLDMAMKDRATSPLTTPQVRQIRIRYERGGVTMKQLGVEYGVHMGTIRGIIHRIRWSHVD